MIVNIISVLLRTVPTVLQPVRSSVTHSLTGCSRQQYVYWYRVVRDNHTVPASAVQVHTPSVLVPTGQAVLSPKDSTMWVSTRQKPTVRYNMFKCQWQMFIYVQNVLYLFCVPAFCTLADENVMVRRYRSVDRTNTSSQSKWRYSTVCMFCTLCLRTGWMERDPSKERTL